MATPSKGKTIMISYSWNCQERVKEIWNKLKIEGYDCWIDIEKMSGSTNDTMAKAVESSDLVLFCASSGYNKSVNCEKEATYADKLNKKMIPLILEKDYRRKADGWLGILIRDKLCYDFSQESIDEGVFQNLLREIEKVLGVDQSIEQVTVGLVRLTTEETETADVVVGRAVFNEFAASFVGTLWMDLLRRQFSKQDGARIDADINCIKLNTTDAKEQAYEGLCYWKERLGKKATLGALCKKLGELKKCQLADDIEEFYRKSSTRSQ